MSLWGWNLRTLQRGLKFKQGTPSRNFDYALRYYLHCIFAHFRHTNSFKLPPLPRTLLSHPS